MRVCVCVCVFGCVCVYVCVCVCGVVQPCHDGASDTRPPQPVIIDVLLRIHIDSGQCGGVVFKTSLSGGRGF